MAVAVRKSMRSACYSLPSGVLVLSTIGVVGCDSCDLPQFEPGTRFLVTVQNDESVCGGRINFSAEESFELVAGNAARTSGDACEYTPAADAPVFRDSQYEFGDCQGRSLTVAEGMVAAPTPVASNPSRHHPAL